MQHLGDVVVVPVASPETAAALVTVAARIARVDGGVVVPTTVLPSAATRSRQALARELVLQAEAAAEAAGARASGLVVAADDVASGVLEAADERGATLCAMGWQGRSTHRNVFGEIIDSVVGRSSVPLAVLRLHEQAPSRVLLALSEADLLPAGAPALELAAELVRRMADGMGTGVRVLRSGTGDASLPPVVADLADRVHHDPRRHDLAVGAAAGREDLVVLPVPPTVSGLRTATTHVAWAAPEASLLVAVDVGRRAAEPPSLASAVRRAGAPRPAQAPSDGGRHDVVVTVTLPAASTADAPQLDAVTRAAAVVGEVVEGSVAEDADGGRVLLVTVAVTGPDPNAALGHLMEGLHQVAELRGAAIRYDLRPAG